MSIMHKLFGAIGVQTPAPAANPAVASVAAVPNTPGNIPAQQTNPASANNPTAPAAAVAATANSPAPEGLDKFSDMWNIPDANKPKEPESAFAGVTPEAIQQIAGKTDFSKVVTPEMMTAISGGGEQAAAAMIQALNAVAQQTYAQSAQAAIKLSEQATKTQREQLLAELPNIIKQQSVSENLRTSNPIFNHPAASPMLKHLQETLQLKNPTATADQIKKQAEEYLVSFSQAANPQPAQSAQKGKANEPDWDSWM